MEKFDELSEMSINQILLQIVISTASGVELTDEQKFNAQELIFEKYNKLQEEQAFIFNKIKQNRLNNADGSKIQFESQHVGNLKEKTDLVLSKKVVSEHWLTEIGKMDNSGLEQRIRDYRSGIVDYKKRDHVLVNNLTDYAVDSIIHTKNQKGGYILLAGEKVKKSISRMAEKPARRIVREKARRVASEKEKNAHYKPKEGFGEYDFKDGLIQDLGGLQYVFTPDERGIQTMTSFRDYLVRADTIKVYEIEQKSRPANTIHLSVKPLSRYGPEPAFNETDTIEIQLMDLHAFLSKEIGEFNQFNYASLQSLLRDPRLTNAEKACIQDEDRKFVYDSKKAVLDVLNFQLPAGK